jgi:hypothetical protein
MKRFISAFDEEDKKVLPDLEVYVLSGGYSSWEEKFGRIEDMVFFFYLILFNSFG